MNARGLLNSSITLTTVADFFAAEFIARCDFLKNFICSHSTLLNKENDVDTITEAKTIFESFSLSEQGRMKNLYESSVKPIEQSLSNSKMKGDIEQMFIEKMERCIKKNNLYLELAFKEIAAAKPQLTNRWIILQPNFCGFGVDLIELWNRYVGNITKAYGGSPKTRAC
nr:hypothetical protein [Desulfobacula sp.]